MPLAYTFVKFTHRSNKGPNKPNKWVKVVGTYYDSQEVRLFFHPEVTKATEQMKSQMVNITQLASAITFVEREKNAREKAILKEKKSREDLREKLHL